MFWALNKLEKKSREQESKILNFEFPIDVHYLGYITFWFII